MKKFLALILSIAIFSLPTLALELDMTFDEEVRKNYNPSKIELDSLPPLPNVKPTTPVSKPPLEPIEVPKNFKDLPELQPANKAPVISKIDNSTAIKIKKGTKFKVKSANAVSDSSTVGTRLTFTTQKAVTQTYVTIPQGTSFKGKVADAHLPQLSGNGGLIVIEIDGMIFRGSHVGINAKITKANYKKIFLNNIKGKRLYWKGVKNSLQPGTKFYKKMKQTTSKLANGTFTVILTPFTVIAGVGVYTLNFVGSPLFGLFSKGGRITIPAGSDYEIKLLDDVYLY